MNEVFHKIVTIAMAILVLLSTISWRVEKHYCMGRLMDVALFSDVDTCGMFMEELIDENSLSQEKSSCCDDEVFFVDSQDDLQLSFNDIEFESQAFIIAYSYSLLFANRTKKEASYLYYLPPILVKNIQLLDEVYLI